ncbi:helix-turn-helix domain-containing protein [Leptospira stimsonii]|uniref:DNA-binding protein n=1 Tax=Leptospira stimsonii TaxID=2202203 RepID=A0ABY2N595_9LEPT|nr:helix-turn-helix domain-containing protein [Leptospira stimsonii]TGK10392.1 hypothetical protein EHO98_23060 [Leptospira stimsonii]TGM17280.1 hypothetical protein EHQ90_07735 [Leptospira stimsonii]
MGKGGCFATNKSLGEECGFAEETVAKYVRRLRQLGFIEAGKFHGHYRILNSALHDAVIEETMFRRKSSAQGKNPGQGSVKIPASPGQSRSHAPDKRLRSCTLLTKEKNKKFTYKGATFDESSKDWQKFLVWSKERLSKSTLHILNAVTVYFDGSDLNIKTSLPDSIELLIAKYFTEDHPKKFSIKFSETITEENIKSREIERNVSTEKKAKIPVSGLMTEEEIRQTLLELQRIKENETNVLRRGRIAA